jgi:hypothetical protein
MTCEVVSAVFDEYAGWVSPAPDRDTMMKHIDCAYHILSGRYPSRRVGALYGVDHKTALAWAAKALTYDDPEAERLRQFFGRN